ncbi:SDR family NAD(P)-dependent oxidoreductase [Colwellia sp. MSW7]|jgi:short-subunit dehydrogenase|uniref:SDR family NAD(P)-dependent oxidoreductase n=1 Tax=Colwellia maritima TaxID=2912588 RepID=A0ABS9X6I1_9GAMM|nr:SDR family NAD(P)-dependent oxidoreductase [Colwellia maritima]MCI2285832.1 SDR family NAD(P)-dependent oxidoreductase [Colwellia maritima]
MTVKTVISSKTILITGATSGIGLALFNHYSTQGYYKVIACGRDAKKLALLSNRAYKTCLFDLNDADDIKQQLADIDDIDIVILNAGDCRYIDDAKHFDGQLFSDIISTNLSSLGWLLQYTLPKIKKGGQLVFVSSSATILPFPRSEAYGASKAGMDYLANSLRLDLLKENIDVTLVHPGFVKTPLTDKNDFTMPFLITSDEAAKRIISGVEKRKKYLHFPKRLTLLLKFFSLLPSSLWQAIIAKRDKT